MISVENVLIGFRIALPMVVALEALRLLAGGYRSYRWYAAIVLCFIRAWCLSLGLGVFIAYVMSGAGVQQALNLTAEVTGLTQAETPYAALLIVGGLAMFACLGVAEVAAWLFWAVARRRMAWRQLHEFSDWFGDLAFFAADSATTYLLSRSGSVRRILWLGGSFLSPAAAAIAAYLAGASYTTGAIWVVGCLLSYFVLAPALNRIIGDPPQPKPELRNREYADDGRD